MLGEFEFEKLVAFDVFLSDFDGLEAHQSLHLALRVDHGLDSRDLLPADLLEHRARAYASVGASGACFSELDVGDAKKGDAKKEKKKQEKEKNLPAAA